MGNDIIIPGLLLTQSADLSRVVTTEYFSSVLVNFITSRYMIKKMSSLTVR